MAESIVELKPRPREKVKMTLSGGRFCTIPQEQAYSLSIGLELSDSEIEAFDTVDQYFRGKDKLVRMIASRARTREEVRKKLTSMEISDPVRDRIVFELEEMTLIDDKALAEEYVRVKTEVRFLGPYKIRVDLIKRGVSRDIIDSVLATELEGDGQEAQARALVERKIGAGVVDEKVVRRMAGLLQRKGYDFEIINRISYELLQRAGDESASEPF